MSASRGSISITARAEHEAELDSLLGQIEALARESSRRDGLSLSVTYADRFPETCNDSACADKVRQAARALGLPVVDLPQPHRPSEDFGNILKAVPGAAFQIGNGEDYPAVHTYPFDFPDEILETAVELYKQILSLP